VDEAAGEGGAAVSLTTRELEKDVQRTVYRLLVKCGCKVYWMSQARKTRQTRGIPDLIAFSPRKGLAFIECKAKGEKPRKDQRTFANWCNLTGVTYILADSWVPVRDWLTARPVK
jgi:hypothetical protein